ncbi:hypothetical protein LguiB_008165 [Lonicera macranthoides]
MADEEPKPLAYVPEIILKKRKINEEWAIRRKQQLKHRVRKSKEDNSFFKRHEQKNDMHPKTRKILYSLRLRRRFNGVFVKANERILEMLQKVEPYVTYE